MKPFHHLLVVSAGNKDFNGPWPTVGVLNDRWYDMPIGIYSGGQND